MSSPLLTRYRRVGGLTKEEVPLVETKEGLRSTLLTKEKTDLGPTERGPFMCQEYRAEEEGLDPYPTQEVVLRGLYCVD